LYIEDQLAELLIVIEANLPTAALASALLVLKIG
jgi:hypothetical protein